MFLLSEVHSGLWEGTKVSSRAMSMVTPLGGSGLAPFFITTG